MSKPQAGDIEAMVGTLGRLAAEVGAPAAEDLPADLLRTPQKAVLEAGQCVAAVVVTDGGSAELLRAAVQALSDASRAVEQLRSAIRARRDTP